MWLKCLKWAIYLALIAFITFSVYSLSPWLDKQFIIYPNLINKRSPTVPCPTTPPNLEGPVRLKFAIPTPKWEELEAMYANLEIGGHSRPDSCVAQHRVAIIVPYRDRDQHLRIFLHNIHAFLAKQQLDYCIYIVEQVTNQTFNRAKLMNVGYVEASKDYDWKCYIFHDVDLLPENDKNLYSCPRSNPRHMSVGVDKFNYALPYKGIFGGVSALTKEQFLRVNGYSNSYWGWGGEDDDMSTRLHTNRFSITRYSSDVARYKMIRHGLDAGNRPNSRCTKRLMRLTRERWRWDGLNSLNYTLIGRERHQLFTRITVDLIEAQSRTLLRSARICV